MNDSTDFGRCRNWAIYEKKVYDVSDYLHTLALNQNAGPYKFLDDAIMDVFKQQPGQDITERLNKVIAGMDPTVVAHNMNCIGNMFYMGNVDFRKSAKCQTQGYMLLIFSAIMMTSMGLKCKWTMISFRTTM